MCCSAHPCGVSAVVRAGKALPAAPPAHARPRTSITLSAFKEKDATGRVAGFEKIRTFESSFLVDRFFLFYFILFYFFTFVMVYLQNQTGCFKEAIAVFINESRKPVPDISTWT